MSLTTSPLNSHIRQSLHVKRKRNPKKAAYLIFATRMNKLRKSLKDFYMAHEEKFWNPDKRRSCLRAAFGVIPNGLRGARAAAKEMLPCT